MQDVTATELLPKLRLLYNMGIVSFVHHIGQTAAKVNVKQQNAHIGQFPDHATMSFG